MLQIDVSGGLIWDENSQKFRKAEACSLELEHCLLAVSKWEARWKKPFFNKKEGMTVEQSLDYIKCMTFNGPFDNSVYLSISNDQMKQIKDYIDDPMSATWFNKNTINSKRKSEIVTSELIYYWMTALNIPFVPCETWHLQRLMNLITIGNLKNQPPKKMSKSDILKQNAAANALRRAKV